MGKRFPVNATDGTLRRIVAALGLMIAVGGLAACTTEAPPPSNPGPVIVPGKPGEEASTIPPGKATQAPSTPPTDADIEFVQDMIAHHQQAIWMSDLAPERASSRDVKELASRISDVQGLEIGAMNQWLAKNAVPTVDPTAPGHHGGGSMPGMATQEQLQALQNAKGTDFDTQWLRLMITHHEGAITMANEIRSTSLDDTVQKVADDVVVEQTDEIGIMRGWLGS